VAPAAAPAADDRNDGRGAPGGFGNPQTPGMAANDVFERGDAAQSKPPAISSSATASDEMFDDAQDDDAQDDGAKDLEEPVESTRPMPPAPAAPSAAPRAPSEPALLSPRATAAVDLAFNTLAHTVLVQNSRTLEDLVRGMLKPMLKAWLDDNLPNMVERLVRAEIERVSRGRG
jgi:uncharacterized protein